MSAPATNVAEYTVSELSFALKRTVENEFEHVRVRGEISGFKGAAGSGHCYFTLKDSGAALEAVVWRTTFQRLKFKPEEGLEMVATGRLTTYPSRSRYQLVVDHLEPAGAGALMALLEERRKKLAAEGLFDAGAEKADPLSADDDRRRHLADRRGDPRHPASPARPVSRAMCSSGRCACRGKARRRRSRRRSAASTRSPAAARFRVPIF